MPNIKIIATDLDGTLLNDNLKVSTRDIKTMECLKKYGIIRIAATGRSLNLSLKVLQQNFPIDYLIFSTGAGIMEWQTKQIIYKSEIEEVEVEESCNILLDNNITFTLHPKIPDTHKYLYHKGTHATDELELLNKKNTEKVFPADRLNIKMKATSLRAIVPNEQQFYEQLKKLFPENLQIMRLSSPINKKYMWIEFFKEKISKGYALSKIAEKHNISNNQILTIGNDYNDTEMLNYAKYSRVTGNAPKELKIKYNGNEKIKTNNQAAFSFIVEHFIKQEKKIRQHI